MKAFLLALGVFALSPIAACAQTQTTTIALTEVSAPIPANWVRPWNVNNVICHPEIARRIETAASVLTDPNTLQRIRNAEERQERLEVRSADGGVVTSLAVTDALKTHMCLEAF